MPLCPQLVSGMGTEQAPGLGEETGAQVICAQLQGSEKGITICWKILLDNQKETPLRTKS